MNKINTKYKISNTYTSNNDPKLISIVENDEERKKIKHNDATEQRMSDPHTTPCNNNSRSNEVQQLKNKNPINNDAKYAIKEEGGDKKHR